MSTLVTSFANAVAGILVGAKADQGRARAEALRASCGAEHTLLIDGEPLTWELRLSARRRTFAIEVHPDLRVVVRAPARDPLARIEKRVAERAHWIERQLRRLSAAGHVRPVALRYISGETHLYIGEPHRLEVGTARRARVTRVTGALHVAVPVAAEPERVARALQSWYRARAQEVFAEVLSERFAAFERKGHACPTLTIRRMRTRWGSLAGMRRRSLVAREPAHMTLNLALIRAPRDCIEYVVVHELCHLEERGHGLAFRALLDELLPDWRERRRKLDSLGLV